MDDTQAAAEAAQALAQKRLNKAKEQIAAGKNKAAVATLVYVAPDARGGDVQAARGLLDLASRLRDATQGKLRQECEDLVTTADTTLNSEARLRERVGALGVSFSPARLAIFEQDSNRPRAQGCTGILWFTERWIGFGTGEGERGQPYVPVEAVAVVELSGGRVAKDKGDLIREAAIGGAVFIVTATSSLTAAIRSANRRLDSETTVDRTWVSIRTRAGERLLFQVEDWLPENVRTLVVELLQQVGVPLAD
jgi:hypothetical protein